MRSMPQKVRTSTVEYNVKVEVSPELERTLVRRGIILKVCCEPGCGEFLGQVDAEGARGGVSGGLCNPCLHRKFGLGDDNTISIDYAEPYPRPPDRSFMGGVLVTFAIVMCALSVLGLAW